jgi:hypothetical protein
MDRRAALKATFALSLAACRSRVDATPTPTPSTAGRMPSIFLAHGSPMLLEDASWMAELAAWARVMPRPKSILMISAHGVDAPITLGATGTVPLLYDFYGFPEKHYQVKYPAPGAPQLAARLRAIFPGSGWSTRRAPSPPTASTPDSSARCSRPKAWISGPTSASISRATSGVRASGRMAEV